MPYKNEHAARINDPDKYDTFNRQNNKFGRGVDVIWGIKNKKGKNKVDVQALRFNIDNFTVKAAEKWLKENDYKPILFEPAKKAKKIKESFKEFYKNNEI